MGVAIKADVPTPTYRGLPKRALDVTLAAIGLGLCLPVITLAALVARIDTPGGPFYGQMRVGKNGRHFRCWKIRTMLGEGLVSLEHPEHRVTRVGRALRRTKLDELPQLWNVLVGDMSLVGPRPVQPCMQTWLDESVLDHSRRLVVRPGVTGLAQISMARPETLQACAQRLQYDLVYIQNQNLWLDLRILWKTLVRF